MQACLRYIMRSPWHLLLGVALLSVFPITRLLVLPIIGLATLSNGARYGFAAFVVAMVFSYTGQLWFSASTVGQEMPGAILSALVGQFLPIWIGALLLLKTRSLSYALQAGALVLAGYIVLLTLAQSLPTQQEYLNYYECIVGCGDHAIQQQQVLSPKFLETMATVSSAGWAAMMFVVTSLWLVVARHWQRILFEQHQDEQESHREISMIKTQPLFAMVVMPFAGLTFLNADIPLFLEVLAWLGLGCLAVFGIALGHWLMARRFTHVAWFVLYYVAILSAVPAVLFLFAVMAVSDSLLNWRERVSSE